MSIYTNQARARREHSPSPTEPFSIQNLDFGNLDVDGLVEHLRESKQMELLEGVVGEIESLMEKKRSTLSTTNSDGQGNKAQTKELQGEIQDLQAEFEALHKVLNAEREQQRLKVLVVYLLSGTSMCVPKLALNRRWIHRWLQKKT